MAGSLRRAEPHFSRWVAGADARLQACRSFANAWRTWQNPWSRRSTESRRQWQSGSKRRLSRESVAAGKNNSSSCMCESGRATWRRARATPVLLDHLARTYFGFDSGHMSSDPIDSLRNLLDSDESLVSATLSGFERVLERDDLPDLDEIVRLDSEGKYSRLALPVLAGLAEGDRTGCGGHRTLTADGIKRAAGFYYLIPRPTVRGPRPGWYRPAGVPDWYDELVRSHAELVAASLVAVHRSKIRRKVQCEEDLAPVAWDPKYRELAQLAAPSLLRAFPLRCTRPQNQVLRHLLWASVRYMPQPCVRDGGEARAFGMDVAQRTLWLGAGMLVSPDLYLPSAMEFIGDESTVRVRHLMGFVVPDGQPLFSMEWSTEHLAMAVRGRRREVEPWRFPGGNEGKAYLMTPADEAANDAANKARRLLSAWLARLAKKPGAEAADALETLANAPELAAWRHDILEARDQQVVLRRVHLHPIPTADEVRKVLQDGQPASSADLLALLVARLEQLATEIRDGNTNGWRHYWNVDSHGRPTEPRPEPVCRDALLSALRNRFPTGVNVVDAQPEVQYAEGKRSDIRVSCGGHAVPVEIKKNTHPRLWSAINDQLIDQYVRAPESNGARRLPRALVRPTAHQDRAPLGPSSEDARRTARAPHGGACARSEAQDQGRSGGCEWAWDQPPTTHTHNHSTDSTTACCRTVLVTVYRTHVSSPSTFTALSLVSRHRRTRVRRRTGPGRGLGSTAAFASTSRRTSGSSEWAYIYTEPSRGVPFSHRPQIPSTSTSGGLSSTQYR